MFYCRIGHTLWKSSKFELLKDENFPRVFAFQKYILQLIQRNTSIVDICTFLSYLEGKIVWIDKINRTNIFCMFIRSYSMNEWSFVLLFSKWATEWMMEEMNESIIFMYCQEIHIHIALKCSLHSKWNQRMRFTFKMRPFGFA